ncbi:MULTISPECIES: glucuronate isomerase [unclassified Paenibacillus]|uniref:glucuronate isomerase n=1 Tax=unclassified Paenibacillus TaxID=185978 RepID=UPI002404BA87|nr:MULTISPECIES: glucuronate isomerase [unclassified Paenibacillus]MDF9840609.1 glucuronate isomerase [Paenibacillus sp. PastF-2]MDF9847191.1 glucuronate isomerase [Paenibacillus sp. PastM-2]MDF9853763.1 glucuronate isomerase [Paenibacillus sp. PastF-1]MDH6478751.1 glucuronate isomerase [Paenibacillus sp. PastH-2]MDH6506483.1 glucuronate isomerase [Paenibacillus sp. PastM-3]
MFLNDDFLLTTEPARQLFHEYAAKMPIIDYHCHLDPREIYEDQPFKNLTAAWLYGDHYKWRLMRANGIPESHITGDASDYDKFLAWARTLPKAVGNPLYSWTHLELRRFFGINEPLNEQTAPAIWEEVNRRLAQPEFTRRGLIRSSRVKTICTTDDPADSLEYHQLLKENEKDFSVFPTFRPDKALNIDAPGFPVWIAALEKASGLPVTSYAELVEALKNRVDFFHENGCRLSDHALDVLRYRAGSDADAQAIFAKRLEGAELTAEEITLYRTELLTKLIGFYHDKDWTMQLHLHAYRNNNTPMFQRLGPDTGYDGINDLSITESLSRLLDRAECGSGLPKTILYSLNAKDYPALLALMGCYQKDTAGKMQLGSGWWYNDTRNGMREQLTLLADNSLLGNFVGMLTDSRSFLSYTRHEYFRRVLCGLLGELVERGEAPDDTALLGQLVQDISYNNAAGYFGFPAAE